MSKIVTKKVLPEYFQLILDGKKNFELRLNHNDVEEGDTLILEEWTTADKSTRVFTGRKLEKKVKYVFRTKLHELWWTEEQLKEKGIQIISFDN